MTDWQALLAGWAVMVAVMAALWNAQRRSRRADWVDFAWALGTAGIAAACALAAAGNSTRGILVAGLACAWGGRLAWHLGARIRRSNEDDRYARLRGRFGESADRWLFWFFQFQALLCAVLAVPALIAARNDTPLGWPDLAGLLVWAVAIAGEVVADRQLNRFRSERTETAAVCRSGLWAHSRHPNYFFEWIHWWSYVFIGWAAPQGWLTLLAPALMLLLICKVTGIPPVERAAVAKRGEAYREYQRSVSAFVPWPSRPRA